MRCALPFTKMQALGNDFVFVDEEELASTPLGAQVSANLRQRGAELARRVCDRHFGIGADGLIFVRTTKRPDCQLGWLYFNGDGSISDMCGNGLRCLALWASENKRVSGKEFAIETAIGAVAVIFDGAHSITTDLGEPALSSKLIPIAGSAQDKVVSQVMDIASKEIGSKRISVTCVNMGNPHCVIFQSGLTDEEQRAIAPKLQLDPRFPESVNVEFVTVNGRDDASVFVWERGCGPTLACASGAAAVLVAGVLEGRLDRTAKITLPGGSLRVSWSAEDNRVRIEGPASVSYKGVFDLAEFLPEDCHK